MKARSVFFQLLLSSVAALCACGGGAGSSNCGNNITGPGPGQTSSYCVDKCVAHESKCGVANAQPDCEKLCAEYKPFRSQVDCAMAVSCGDRAGLFACLPDLKCQARCVEHEQDCGDPSPEAGCSMICSQYRPTPKQVSCAEAVACGNNAGLVTCVQGNHD